ncbi:hypothetical protein CDD83_3159 [Cordyceps sp. RAO-2017]|nr:hypothetical protein CDD83_3159 [Cordyceps sp. RAO-2017]
MASRHSPTEKDELTHKAVLDGQFLQGDASVRRADQVLDKQGTFQFVVDGLENMAKGGDTMSRRKRAAAIRAINQDRCVQVLPSIDAYFRAAGAASDGRTVQAQRPTNCPPGTGGQQQQQQQQGARGRRQQQ